MVGREVFGRRDRYLTQTQIVAPVCCTAPFLIPHSAPAFLDQSPGSQPSAPHPSPTTHQQPYLLLLAADGGQETSGGPNLLLHGGYSAERTGVGYYTVTEF